MSVMFLVVLDHTQYEVLNHDNRHQYKKFPLD
jgi:hypothetical protein